MNPLDDFIEQVIAPRPFPIEQAACRGIPTELFFPARGEDVNAAKTVCNRCQVKDACATWALNNGEKFGIWGGTSERERRKARQKAAHIAPVASEHDARQRLLRRATNHVA